MFGITSVTRKFAVVTVIGFVLMLACGLDAQDNATQSSSAVPGIVIKRLGNEAKATASPPQIRRKVTARCGSSRGERVQCCKKAIKDFKDGWFYGGIYLQSLFERLKELDCSFVAKKFCITKLFARFSDYSRLTYDYHCEPQRFQDECKETVGLARGRSGYFNSSWSEVTADMNSVEFSTEDLEKPCLQVALYGSQSGGRFFYHETVDVYIPFCGVSWCGFDAKSIEDRGLSAWNCIPARCRNNIIVASVVCGLLATAIILANVTVIVVFSTSPKLRNSQAVYKISLAFADLLVGVIVLPTFISTLMILYQGQVSMGEMRENTPANSEGTLPRNSGGRFEQRFPNGYINFVGFFTYLSLIVSVYTLMMAGFDRFMAIYKPLSYRYHKAKRIAMWSSLGLWVSAIFFSAMPLFLVDMAYGLAASIMVASLDTPALILYAIVVLVPLVVVWATTFATFLATKTHARVRKTMRVRRGSQGVTKNANMEARLAKTLGAMVGTFTACLLPAAIVLLIPLRLTNIRFEKAEAVNIARSERFVGAEFVAIVIFMTNSLWNCIIYNARSDPFKKRAKYLYARVLSSFGFNVLWKRTRSFASSTMRSRRSTQTSSLFPFSARQTSKSSAGSTRTNDAGANDGQVTANRCNGRYSETHATTAGNAYRYTQKKIGSISELDQISQPETPQGHALASENSANAFPTGEN